MLRFSWPRSRLDHRRKAKKSLFTSQYAPCITFTPDDMQVKRKYDRPLYFMGYIGSSEVSRIQFEVSRIQLDPGSALSIMPRRVMQQLGILIQRSSATQTTIYGFNANGTRPMGKIKLKCEIEDLRSEMTCMLSTPTLHIICYWDDHGFIATPSSPLLSIKS